MITILSKDNTGKEKKRSYDPISATFFSSSGDVLNVSRHVEKVLSINDWWKGKFPRTPRHDNQSNGKSNKPSSIRIQLGLLCNYQCTYCNQAPYVTETVKSTNLDVDEFISKFDTWCHLAPDDYTYITLWGGEPLLYFSKIKRLVTFLRERLPKADIELLSNASLFNKESCEFFLENRVGFAISHDGESQNLYRSGDCLQEDSTSLFWLKEYLKRSHQSLLVNVVLSKHNLDFKNTIQFFKDKLGIEVRVRWEGVVVIEEINDATKDILFAKTDYEKLVTSVRDFITDDSGFMFSPFNSRMFDLLSAWNSRNFDSNTNVVPRCQMNTDRRLAVNLKGDVLVCQSSSECIGSVYRSSDIAFNKSLTRTWQDREECKNCLVLQSCRGGCLFGKGLARAFSCENEYHFNKGIFEAAFKLVFNETIIGYEDETVRPLESYGDRFKYRVIPIESF